MWKKQLVLHMIYQMKMILFCYHPLVQVGINIKHLKKEGICLLKPYIYLNKGKDKHDNKVFFPDESIWRRFNVISIVKRENGRLIVDNDYYPISNSWNNICV